MNLVLFYVHVNELAFLICNWKTVQNDLFSLTIFFEFKKINLNKILRFYLFLFLLWSLAILLDKYQCNEKKIPSNILDKLQINNQKLIKEFMLCYITYLKFLIFSKLSVDNPYFQNICFLIFLKIVISLMCLWHLNSFYQQQK